MRLIRQANLAYQQGNSDKVYEVDLCEVGPDQFVVNFRYGRRGATLRDGTKTATAVSESAAVSIFEELVASKEAKGYQQPGSEANQPAAESAASSDEGLDPTLNGRRLAVVERLKSGDSVAGKWPLSRAAWRAGELRLSEAEPFLIALIESADAMLDYCIAWALGQCGTSASIEPLRKLEAEHSAETVRRIAGVALFQLLEGDERNSAITECVAQLPESLRRLAMDGPADAFANELNRVLAQEEAGANVCLEIIYLIDNEHVRPALLDFLSNAPLEPGKFHRVRHIFKAAELKRDPEVFGVLSRRFEVTPPRYRSYGAYNYQHQPAAGPNPTQAFSQQTRKFLRRRVWRTLSRYADLGDASEYTRMAAGVLKSISDADGLPARREQRYEWNQQTRRGHYETTHFDKFWSYYSFNQILYGNSSRYSVDANQLKFQCVPPFEPGGAVPESREESYPDLWEKHPETVLELLGESRCEPVHQFGVKVLTACSAFCEHVAVSSLITLLQAPYEVTAQFGFQLAAARYDANNPDLQLVSAVALADYEPARKQAFEWINANRTAFLGDSDFVVALLTGPHGDTRVFARNALRDLAIPDPQAKAVIGRLMSVLQSLAEDDGAVAGDIVEALLLVFGHHLRRVTEDVIRDLLQHILPEVQRFAGDLVLGHDTFSRQPPDDVIRALLEADHEGVRRIGVQIIGQLPDHVLRSSIDLLISLTRHEKPDIRDQIRGTVVRLCESDSLFGERLAALLIEALLIPGAPDGVPTHTARVLREDLRSCLRNIPSDTVWKLLQSRSGPAQEVGGALLATNVNPADLTVDEIVKLGNHEILSVRESAWQMCRENLPKLKDDPEAAARIVDSRWEDTREFGFKLLRENFTENGALSPTILISVCDSVQPDVQQFGRELITRLFDEEDGEEYVARLSEHPSASMQQFVSNFLDRHVADDVDQLEQLSPYFVSVLSRVNRGRIAKTRALLLLEREGLKSEVAARIAAEILSRLSATAAINDRASAVEILLRLQAAWPTIESPLRVKPVEVRGGV